MQARDEVDETGFRESDVGNQLHNWVTSRGTNAKKAAEPRARASTVKVRAGNVNFVHG